MAASQTTYQLGYLTGNVWFQYANAAGQVYYFNTSSQQSQYEIPTGFEDHSTDQWARDNSQTWPQWQNQRTGRIMLRDPNPPPPQTYLDLPHVAAHMGTIEKTPESPEHLYRRAFVAILRALFPNNEGFDVTQEETSVNTRPDSTIFKISSRPGGSRYAYEFCLIESKKNGEPWGSTEDQLGNHTFNTENDSRQVYGIVHIGMEIKMYRANQGSLTALSGKMHLRRDVQTITQ